MPTSSSTTRDSLFTKLLAAQTGAQTVEKRGENKAQGYTYAQASDVIEEAQRALHEAGLVGYMVPGDLEAREIASQGGSAGLFVTLTSTLRIIDPEGGEVVEITCRGTGVDYPGDKAAYKAMTGAAKYAYASALGIPFGDDPEAETGGAGQARQASGDAPATGPQKGAITRILNKAGVSEQARFALVEAIGGKPLSKSGASKILDRIAPAADDPVALAAAIDALWAEADIAEPSDVPADLEGLDVGDELDEPEPEEPTLLEDRPDTEKA